MSTSRYTGDIGRRDSCAVEIANEQVGMNSGRNNAVLVLKYDCRLVVRYDGTERCIGKSASNTGKVWQRLN